MQISPRIRAVKCISASRSSLIPTSNAAAFGFPASSVAPLSSWPDWIVSRILLVMGAHLNPPAGWDKPDVDGRGGICVCWEPTCANARRPPRAWPSESESLLKVAPVFVGSLFRLVSLLYNSGLPIARFDLKTYTAVAMMIVSLLYY